MLKGNKLYSILFNKCPRCHQGDFFVTKSAYNRRFDKMQPRCEVCGLDYEREPGYYTGALYVSYALYVAWTISTFVVFYTLLNVDIVAYLWGLIPSLILLTPYFFRVARRVWINLFVDYQPIQK
jgi:uncharacterized protein (DUF983 family)